MTYFSCLPDDSPAPYLPSVDVYAAGGHVMLVPGVRDGKGGIWALAAEFERVTLADPGLGDVICEVLGKSRVEESPSPLGGSIDIEMSSIFRVPVGTTLFRKVKYGRILGQRDETVVFHPSDSGVLLNDLPRYQVRPVPEELAEALRKMVDQCKL